MMPQAKAEALKRMSYIQGHLDGVRKMIDEEKYCVDILKQLFAVRKAMEKLDGLLLEGHLNTCVVEGVRNGREKEVLRELVELYSLAPK